MRIAYIGIKGLPGTSGGIETHVHELGRRLAARGHDVTAYVRPHYTPREITEQDGITLRHLPTIASKHLDASVHSFLSSLDTIVKSYHIVHFHAIGPGAFAPLALPSRSKIITTIHRMDYLSGKWGRFARFCLQSAERVCLKTSHRTIVIAPWLQAHYRELGYDVEFIPNGVPLPEPGIGTGEIRSLGLEPNGYFLFLGRLVPEKRPDWMIRAFMDAMGDSATRLVIAGGSSATDDYVEELKRLAEPAGDRIRFTGPVYGDTKEQLLAHARTFLLPSALEGLPITLLEAMSYGRPCLVSDIPPHRDVLAEGENGLMHSQSDLENLKTRMVQVDGMSPDTLAEIGRAARRTVREGFDWDDITGQTEELYRTVLSEAR